MATEIHREESEVVVENYCLPRFRDYELHLVKYMLTEVCVCETEVARSESIYHFI